MVNLCVLLGTGTGGDDILHKIQWLRHIDEKNEVYVVSRIGTNHLNNKLKQLIGETAYFDIKEGIEELKRLSKSFSFIYDSYYLKKNYTKDEIEDLQKWIGISFSYIASMDRRFYDRDKLIDKRDNKELINFIAGLIKFIKDFYTKNDIKVLINTIEDDIFSVIGYYVAKKFKIEIIGLIGSKFPSRGFMFCKDYKEICSWNLSEIEIQEILNLYSDSTIAGKTIMDKNIEYWNIKSFFSRINGLISVIRYRSYVNEVEKYHNYEKFIFDPSINIFNQSKKYMIKFIRLLLMKKIMKKPNLDEKYFLFPLHYMEDAQMTFREPLINQFEIIKTISRSLPLNYYLYVKPHPHHLGTDLSIRKMYELSLIENIKIINPQTPNMQLLKSSSGIITINSTTGFEAMMMDIPVITLGHDFYCKDGLCIVLRELNNLSGALTDLLTDNTARDNLVEFIKKVYANTILIKAIDYSYGFYGLTLNDGKKMALALNSILEEIHEGQSQFEI